MGIRGFGTIFGEQQTGDVGNVGIDFFFEMLFESFSKLRGRVGRADKEAHAHLFDPDKSMLTTDQALERLAALEECRELG